MIPLALFPSAPVPFLSPSRLLHIAPPDVGPGCAAAVAGGRGRGAFSTTAASRTCSPSIFLTEVERMDEAR